MRNSSAKPPMEIPPFVVSDFMSGFPPFLLSFLHLHHHHHAHHHHHPHHHRPSSKSPRLAWSSSPSSSVSPLLFLPSILPCSVLPSSFLPPSITSAPPLCWCRWRRRCRCRPVAGVNKQNQFLEFLKESKVRCFSKTKEIPRISHLKSGKNPEIVERKVTTQRVGIRSCKNSRNFWTFSNCRVSTTQKGIEDVLAAVYLWKGRYIYEREAVLMKGRMYFWRAWCIYEGEGKVLEFLKESKVRCFSKTKEILGISHFKSGQKSGNFRKKSHNLTYGNPFLQKFPEIFWLFATARFHNSKGNWRCAGCRFVRDADGAQISIKKSRNIMRNGSARPPMEIPPAFFAIRRFRFYGIINNLKLYL